MTDLQNKLSTRAVALKPSGIRRFFDIANEMDGVISLGVGEPDFKTPYSVRRAGIENLQSGKTGYSANAGLIELRRAICRYLERKFELSYDPKTEVIVTVGGSEAIDLAIRAFLNPGDEVLIPEPCFVCYDPIVRLTDGVPVAIPTSAEDHFRLTPEKLEAAITPKTKLLVLPYPNNPTGGVMRKEHLEAIAEVIKRHDLIVLSDEIYAELTYNGHHVSIASLPGMKERTIVVNGFSKTYAMTGWRLGYLRAPRWLARRIIAFQSHTTSNPTTFAQYGAIAALEGKADKEVRHMCEEFAKRRDLVYELISAIPGVKCIRPQGAFYLLCDVSSFGMTSEEFCNRLLAEEKLAAIPCCSFGAEGQIRLSYACSEENIRDAAGRLDAFCREHGN